MTRDAATLRILRLIVPVGLALLAVALAATAARLDAFHRSPYPLSPIQPYTPAATLLVGPTADAVRFTSPPLVPVETVLRRGQTLEQALQTVGLERRAAYRAARAVAEHVDPRRLRPGDRVAAYVDRSARPLKVELRVADRGRVLATNAGEVWAGHWRPFSKIRRVRTVRGELAGSLTGAVAEAGAPVDLAYSLAEVLQWDLDFNRDLRTGDRFEVLFEEIETDGRKVSVGEVLALIYESRAGEGRTFEAYRFEERDGYYDAEGRPLAKMFLRSPLRFSRVTSRFSRSRFHPVLHTYRPHYGVDYGAPVGTPVRSTASGTVTFAGWDRGGGGRTVKIRHAKGYLTGYLHLSRIAGGIRPGARVSQGQILGAVGSTGLATGPHLDYRIRHHGRWIDPLRIDNVKADPLGDEDLERFRARRDVLRTRLAAGGAAAGEEPALPDDGGAELLATEAADGAPDGGHVAGG